MIKFVYFVALSLALFVFLSCVHALKDSIEVMTMDPAERKAYISLSEEEKDKYLQMNQNEKDQFRADHDPEVMAIHKQLDAATRKLEIANEELGKVSDPKDRFHNWTPVGGGEAVWAKGPPPGDDRINTNRRTRWFMWEDKVRKWQKEVKRLDRELSSLQKQRLKGYAEARTAWDAKNKQAGAHTSGSCFTTDTLVLMESGFKRIADINVGDRVRTVDPEGNRAVNEVVENYVFTNNHYYLINGEIKVTALHRFYTLNGWIRARDLKRGDRIETSGGSFEEIISKELFSADLTVYNLNIADNHNFFVSSDGKKGYLVHNCGGGGK